MSRFDIGHVETTTLIEMERYTLQERIEIIKIQHKNGEKLAESVRESRTFSGRRGAPCRTTIKKLVEKFELLGQVSDVKNKNRAHVEENPGFSIHRRFLKLGIPQTSLHRILHKDKGVKAYKVQLTQEFKPADHQQRRIFAYWAVEMHENDPEFHLE